MKYLRFWALALALVFLFAACAGENSGKPVPAETPAGPGGETLPQPIDPAAETETSDSTQSLPVPDQSTEPDQTTAPETEPELPALETSEVFTDLFPACPPRVIAVILNDPFPDGRPQATVQWNDGEFDRLCLVPRFPGSTVSAYRLSVNDAGEIIREEAPSYTAISENGSVYGASLDRPEGFPAWYVEVTTPDGRVAGMSLEYNGRTGTPPYEFLSSDPAGAEDFVSTIVNANIVPLSENDLNAFVSAAGDAGLGPWEAVEQYFTQLKDIGDGSSFIMSYGHEMDGANYSFQIAKVHENYLIEAFDLDSIVTGQYAIYEQMGNDLGILGYDTAYDADSLPDLTYRLTGLTVFNHLLAAKEIRVTVNGEELGVYTLPRTQFAVLIPVDLPEQIADRPIRVDVTVLSTWFGENSGAWIDVYGGLSSNISSAR